MILGKGQHPGGEHDTTGAALCPQAPQGGTPGASAPPGAPWPHWFSHAGDAPPGHGTGQLPRAKSSSSSRAAPILFCSPNRGHIPKPLPGRSRSPFTAAAIVSRTPAIPPARHSKMAAPLNLALSRAGPPFSSAPSFPAIGREQGSAPEGRGGLVGRVPPGSAPGGHEQEEPGLLRAAGRARLPQPLQVAGRVSGRPHGGHQGNALARGWEGVAPAPWRFTSLDAPPSPLPAFSHSGRWGISVPRFCGARGSRNYSLTTD